MTASCQDDRTRLGIGTGASIGSLTLGGSGTVSRFDGAGAGNGGGAGAGTGRDRPLREGGNGEQQKNEGKQGLAHGS